VEVLLDPCPVRLEHVPGCYPLLTPRFCGRLNSTPTSHKKVRKAHEFCVGQDKDSAETGGISPIPLIRRGMLLTSLSPLLLIPPPTGNRGMVGTAKSTTMPSRFHPTTSGTRSVRKQPQLNHRYKVHVQPLPHICRPTLSSHTALTPPACSSLARPLPPRLPPSRCLKDLTYPRMLLGTAPKIAAAPQLAHSSRTRP